MSDPKLLDLYSCAGGAAYGYNSAGFDVYGVDISPQKNYPYAHCVGDVIEVLESLLIGLPVRFTRKDGSYRDLYLDDFDAIHASPPCQAYSIATAGNPYARSRHTRLIAATRDLLEQADLPYVIENVAQAKSEMRDPIMLCGRMFNLGAWDEDGERLVLDRHRLFESSVPLEAPHHPKHYAGVQVAGVYGGSRRSSKPNATPADDRYAAKHERKGGYVPRSKRVQQDLLGVDWMTIREMQECIPPTYAYWVGSNLKAHIERRALVPTPA